MKEWYLIRPGIRLMGQWAPDLYDYPFRFEGPQEGDTVYVIVRNRETKQFKVAEDKIAEITDHGADKPASERGSYLVDYWIDEYNPGHGLTFGDVLFETEESAREILADIEANIEKWDVP